MIDFLYRNARKVIVGVVGSTIVLIGVVMFFFPGPGLLVVFAGLALLATEFVWAALLLRRVKAIAKLTKQRITHTARNMTGGASSPEKTTSDDGPRGGSKDR